MTNLLESIQLSNVSEVKHILSSADCDLNDKSKIAAVIQTAFSKWKIELNSADKQHFQPSSDILCAIINDERVTFDVEFGADKYNIHRFYDHVLLACVPRLNRGGLGGYPTGPKAECQIAEDTAPLIAMLKRPTQSIGIMHQEHNGRPDHTLISNVCQRIWTLLETADDEELIVKMAQNVVFEEKYSSLFARQFADRIRQAIEQCLLTSTSHWELLLSRLLMVGKWANEPFQHAEVYHPWSLSMLGYAIYTSVMMRRRYTDTYWGSDNQILQTENRKKLIKTLLHEERVRTGAQQWNGLTIWSWFAGLDQLMAQDTGEYHHEISRTILKREGLDIHAGAIAHPYTRVFNFQ